MVELEFLDLAMLYSEGEVEVEAVVELKLVEEGCMLVVVVVVELE